MALDAFFLADHLPFYRDQAMRLGGPALELGSGTGRIARAWAMAGLEVVGLEASRPMVAAALAKLGAMPVEAAARLSFVAGDMAEFDVGSGFALVAAPFRSFQELLSVAEQRSCLASARRALTPGGTLILDLFDPPPDIAQPEAAGEPWEMPSIRHPVTGNTVRVEVLERRTDPAAQIIRESWRFSEWDEQGQHIRSEEEELAMRWTKRAEMRLLFESSGFVIEAEYGGFDRSEPAGGHEQVWVATIQR